MRWRGIFKGLSQDGGRFFRMRPLLARSISLDSTFKLFDHLLLARLQIKRAVCRATVPASWHGVCGAGAALLPGNHPTWYIFQLTDLLNGLCHERRLAFLPQTIIYLGVNKNTNHTMTRKPGPLKYLQYSLVFSMNEYVLSSFFDVVYTL
jgi:hypothetical protein